MPMQNTIGELSVKMVARMNMTILNRGVRRPRFGESIPDITFASEGLVAFAYDWTEMDDYTGSKQNYITFDLS